MFEMYEYEKLTLSAQAYNNKVTIELPRDSNLSDFLEGCKTLAVGITYSEATWRDMIIALADEYRSENEREFARNYDVDDELDVDDV
jgi:hypothetical protein